MKLNALKSRGARNRVFAIVTVLVIAILFALNLLLTHLCQNKAVMIDLTEEELYTLTDLMKEECAYINELEGEVKVTFCTDPDTLLSNQVTRVAYYMALQMQKQFENFTVETVNVTYNPTAVSQYKSTSMSQILPSDVIVSYGTRYRIVNASYFWLSRSTGELIAFNGEYKLANLIKSVTTINRPKAYFTVGHGETYYDVNDPANEQGIKAAALYDMLSDRGLEALTLDLSAVDKVPDDCVLLIINNPTSDFKVDENQLGNFDYVSECEKIDRYITDHQGAVMVAKDYATSLPNIEEFFYEWGFEFGSSLLKEPSPSDPNNLTTDIVTEYDTNPDSYGYAIYGDFASLSSAPSVVVGNSGYIKCSYGDAESINEPGTYAVARNFAPFLYSSDGAIAYAKDEHGEYDNHVDANGRLYVAGITTRLEINTYTGEYKYSYVFCANSGEFFSNETMGNTSFANFEVMSAYTENVIRTDEYADAELGHDGKNTVNRGGKLLADYSIYNVETKDENRTYMALTKSTVTAFTVIIAIIPLAIAVAGIIVRIKRKFL